MKTATVINFSKAGSLSNQLNNREKPSRLPLTVPLKPEQIGRFLDENIKINLTQ